MQCMKMPIAEVHKCLYGCWELPMSVVASNEMWVAKSYNLFYCFYQQRRYSGEHKKSAQIIIDNLGSLTTVNFCP